MDELHQALGHFDAALSVATTAAAEAAKSRPAPSTGQATVSAGSTTEEAKP